MRTENTLSPWERFRVRDGESKLDFRKNGF
jgi:hypothetical protein